MEALDFLTPKLNNEEKRFLLNLSKETIDAFVNGKNLSLFNKSELSEALISDGASFVTLKLNGNLRGCIGSVIPTRPLYVDVMQNSINASSKDPRFNPLTKTEVEKIKISISVLSKNIEIQYSNLNDLFSKIVPFEDGLILENGKYSGLFLPSVWEELPDTSLFLSNLCLKSGFNPSSWHNNIRVYRFRVLYIS